MTFWKWVLYLIIGVFLVGKYLCRAPWTWKQFGEFMFAMFVLWVFLMIPGDPIGY